MAVVACTRSNRRVYIPKPLCGELSPVSISDIAFANLIGVFTPDAVRSFFGGFSSTAGYVPGNEARILRRERLDTFQDDHFHQALFVFIQTTRQIRRPVSAKPFGFDSGRHGQRLSAPSVLKRCVTTSVSPPDAGQVTRKQSRL